MAHLGITDTSWQASPSQRTFSADKIRLGVHKGGILRLHVRPGDEVEQDQILAEILNFQGDTIDRLKSPVRAIVRIVIPKYAVNSGDKVIYLSQLD
jgi:predicted deacylase